MQIGPYTFSSRLCVAPMTGVTDRPFRQLCRALGAGHAVSEMLTSRPELQGSLKTTTRADFTGEPGPITAQIVGSDPLQMAQAARYNVARGAQIIDINLGCPAKKVCNVLAGSALLRDTARVRAILQATVDAVAVPVTLKTRLGYSRGEENILHIAALAEAAGIAALAIHGRTREEMYLGRARYASIAAVKRSVRIPVIANGDIDSPEKARAVLAETGADALMIGRAAQRQPWLFEEIAQFLAEGHYLPTPLARRHALIVEHLVAHHRFYRSYRGEAAACRIARKHLLGYTADLPDAAAFRMQINRIEQADAQCAAVDAYFAQLLQKYPGYSRGRVNAAASRRSFPSSPSHRPTASPSASAGC